MKKVISAVLCIALLLSCVCTTAFAAGEMYTVEADKAVAYEGDTITFTVYMNDCSGVDGGVRNFEFVLSIPAGLTFVAGDFDAGFAAATGFNMPNFNAANKKASSFGILGAGGYTGGKVAILTFTCTVDSGALGNKEVGLTNALYTVGTTRNTASVNAANVEVKVKPVPATGISLNKNELSLVAGASETLIADVEPDNTTDAVVWSSNEESVATVDANGKVTAEAEGTATITAEAGGKSATCVVTVTCAHTGGTATCAAKAVCTVCGKEYGEKNPANHVVADPVIKGAVTESCKDDGYTGDKHCAGCDALLEKGTVITATGAHVDVDSKWESDGTNHWHTCTCGTKFDTTACSGGTATCAAKAVCSTCGNEYGEKNPANHVVAEPVIKGAVTESCKDDGYTGDKHCAGCDALLEKGTVITATGEHKDADGKWESDATNHWHTCACGTKIDVTAHTLKEVADAAYLKSEANCSNAAEYYMSCEICGAKGADTYTFESGEKVATAHKWNDQGICEHNDKHIKFEKEPGEKVEEAIENLVAAPITVKELVEGVLKAVEDLNTLFKDGAIKVEEGKLVYELLPDAPEGEYYVEIGEYVVNIVVAEESVIVDRPDRPSYNSSAAKKVIEMIDELPSAKKVTLDDEEDIEAARKAYEKLSKADKAKVTNYEDLVEVEEALEALKNAAPEVIDNPFVDVDEDAYYADPVLWAVANNITSGTSAVTFSPDAVCTRAQVVTFLWRAAGCPAPLTSDMPFVDVEAGAYYAAAVQWAVENNITAGTSATTFDPNGKCTRGQIVTFLWRAQGNPAAAAVNNFVDVEDGAYYNAPVLWAVANGITNGTSTTTFSPAADCTRAQVVTFIYRCMAE